MKKKERKTSTVSLNFFVLVIENKNHITRRGRREEKRERDQTIQSDITSSHLTSPQSEEGISISKFSVAD